MTDRPFPLTLVGTIVTLFVSALLVWIGYMLALGFRIAGMLCG